MSTILDQSQVTGIPVQNILDNSGFEIWQRGTSFSFTGSGQPYTCDRWYANGNAGQTVTITQESSLIDGWGKYAMKVVATNANSNSFNMVQPVEFKEAYYGKTLTLSVRVKTNLANTIQVGFYIGTGANYVFSNFHSGSGNYETLTVTGTLASSFGPTFNIYIGAVTVAIPNGGTFYADNATLVLGSSAAPFVPLHPQVDLARCQRYFETHGDTSAISIIWRNVASAGNMYASHSMAYLVSKRTNPTLTFTKGTFTLCQIPTIGAGNNGGNDAANWNLQAVTTAGANEYSLYLIRQLDQNSFNALQWDLSSWTASADL